MDNQTKLEKDERILHAVVGWVVILATTGAFTWMYFIVKAIKSMIS